MDETRTTGPKGLTRGKRIAFSCVAAALAIGILEIVSAAVFLPVLERTGARGEADSPRDAAASPGRVGAVVIHPYLGYVLDPAAGEAAGQGFYGDPFGPTEPGDFVVAIVGGSVAEQIYSSRDSVERELRRGADLGSRRIVFRNLAIGGYKQPQQLLAMAYLFALGARIDAVVAVDGFNEAVLPVAENERDGVYAFFPREWHHLTEGTLSREVGSIIGRISLAEEKAAAIRRFLETSWVAKSRTVLAVGLISEEMLEGRLSRLRLALHEKERGIRDRPFATGGPRDRLPEGPGRSQVLAEVWSRSSRQLDWLCRGAGVTYLHFLQPNQYVPGSRTFGPEERKMALNPEHPYRFAVEAAYPAFRAEGARLRAAGVDFHDLTDAFRDEPEPVYFDACCHLTARGLEILGARVGAALADRLNGTPRVGRRRGP